MTADKSAAEAAFREATNRRAALEVRLTDEQRAQYLALRQKQEADLKRQERGLRSAGRSMNPKSESRDSPPPST